MTLGEYLKFRDSMLANGYHPSHNSIDAEVVAKDPCNGCKQPLSYEGFKKDGDYVNSSYRAFMICESCGEVEEF